MLWVNILHFYQPATQQKDILDRIVHESYLPILEGLLQRQHAKTVVNITGALVELLVEHGYTEILTKLGTLTARGQVELMSSAMYHAFLPLLPKTEINRQLQLNSDTLNRYFDTNLPVKGFFPPELAVSDNIFNVISSLGFSWIVAPQVSYGSPASIPDKLYVDNSTGLYVLFRNKRVSALILSAVVHSASDLLHETKDILDTHKYWVTVMDAETFGHHRIGHERLLFDLLDSSHFETLLASELISMDFPVERVNLRPSTWTNQEQDFWLDKEKTTQTTAKSFILWQDPSNPIHTLQWAFVKFVLNEVNAYKDHTQSKWQSARSMLDYAIASDQFWWASTKPWWSLELIEQGAFMLREVIYKLDASSQSKTTAADFYRKILDQAFEWQRNGYIRKRHLESSATFMKAPFKKRAPAEWYNQLVLEFEDEMKKAANNQDFEKAIKWRDALLKLKQGNDIYDVLHVVDELWSARNIPAIKPFFEHSWEDFSDFAKGYFRDIKTKEDFEDWQSSKRT